MLMTMNQSGQSFSNNGHKNKKAEEWTSSCHSILSSLHETLAILYDGVEKDEDNVTLIEEGTKTSTTQTLSETANTFVQQCGELNSLLSTPTNGQMRLPLSAVLGVISRCLKVSYTDVKSTPSLMELTEVLPSIHQSALYTLCLLIVCCKTGLLPQSQAITDLCLQALASSRLMDFAKKCETRASVYKVLCLLVETCGWGQYMTRHSRTVIQEVTADIQCQSNLKQQSENVTSGKKEALLDLPRKGKKKKKNKAESYKDLTAGDGSGADHPTQAPFSSVEVTVQGLELAKLALESLEFSTAEILMRCILDSAVLLQREGASAPSPYVNSCCRKGLYSAVFSCVTVTLGPTSNRKNTVTHFQMTNLALSLLTRGQQLDTAHEVKMACRQALSIFRLTGNMNRPIVRRILPHESNEVRDTTELEREVDKLSEENERLRERLVSSEMDSESQKRLISSLRQEIEQLRSQQFVSETQTRSLTGVTEAGSVDTAGDSGSDMEEEEEERNSHQIRDDRLGAEKEPVKSQAETEQKSEGEGKETPMTDNVSTGQFSEEASSSPLLAPDHTKSRKKKRHPEAESEVTTSRKKSKTKNSTEKDSKHQQQQVSVEERPGCSNQMPSSSGDQKPEVDSKDSEEFDGMQAMIADFVDADPDLT